MGCEITSADYALCERFRFEGATSYDDAGRRISPSCARSVAENTVDAVPTRTASAGFGSPGEGFSVLNRLADGA